MLGFSEHFDVEDVIKVSCYDLHAIDPEWIGSRQPDHEITVCAFSDFDGGDPVGVDLTNLMPYASDIAFVTIYQNLYRVDVAGGTSVLVGQISGLPSSDWFSSAHYASGAVCTDGYLWIFMRSTANANIAGVAKIDPTDASAVGFVQFDTNDGNTDFMPSNGLVALPNGEMACFGLITGSKVYKINAACTTLVQVSDGDVGTLRNGFSGYKSNAIGSVGIFYDGNFGGTTARVYDVSTGITIRDVSGIRYAASMPSVMSDGQRFAWVQNSETIGKALVTVDKDNGGPVVIGDLHWSDDLPSYIDGVQDCFAWGIRNIQGDRL